MFIAGVSIVSNLKEPLSREGYRRFEVTSKIILAIISFIDTNIIQCVKFINKKKMYVDSIKPYYSTVLNFVLQETY